MWSKTKKRKVLHIAKAGSLRLWLHDWFGTALPAWCGEEIRDLHSATKGERPICEKCARKAGWRQLDGELWFIPGSGIVAL